MKKNKPLHQPSVGLTSDEPMVPLSKVKVLSNEYEKTIGKLMDLISTHGKTSDTWGSSIDTIASNDLNHTSIYLLDYENIGNFPALIHLWNKPNDIIYCFMNKNQVAHFDHELSRLEPALANHIHPIVLSASGLNALDIAIGMFIGHISARFQPLGIYVYTHDRGYSVLMEICRFWGINNVEIRQAITGNDHSVNDPLAMVKPVDKPVEDQPIKPMVEPLVQIGKAIIVVKSKASKQQRKDQIVSMMECIKDKGWFDHPISQADLIDHLLITFPHTSPRDVYKLISRSITYGFLSSKKGKLTLVKPIDSNGSMVEPSNPNSEVK